jgi:hypothetical protein
MDTAHALFHHDSRHLLSFLRNGAADRREHSLVLCTALMRTAGLDLNEQADVWARVAEQRSGLANPPPDPQVWPSLHQRRPPPPPRRCPCRPHQRRLGHRLRGNRQNTPNVAGKQRAYARDTRGHRTTRDLSLEPTRAHRDHTGHARAGSEGGPLRRCARITSLPPCLRRPDARASYPARSTTARRLSQCA